MSNASERKARLLPNGLPKYIRCFDTGDGEDSPIDRYTVIYTGRYAGSHYGQWFYVAMNAAPFHPQGFGQHGETPQRCQDGKPNLRERFGKRINFTDLPADCQKFVMGDYLDIWGIR